MTDFPPELIEGARAMYEAEEDPRVMTLWKDLHPDYREQKCQAFAAGLRSFVLVPIKLFDLAHKAGGTFEDQFEAAITYLTGAGK